MAPLSCRWVSRDGGLCADVTVHGNSGRSASLRLTLTAAACQSAGMFFVDLLDSSGNSAWPAGVAPVFSLDPVDFTSNLTGPAFQWCACRVRMCGPIPRHSTSPFRQVLLQRIVSGKWSNPVPVSQGRRLQYGGGYAYGAAATEAGW